MNLLAYVLSGSLCQRSLRNPGGRPGVFLAGGHQKSWLVAL
jgi:hypothetical protein